MATPSPLESIRNSPASNELQVLHRRPLVAAVALALSLTAINAQAALIMVDSSSDTATGVCRLRDAIVAANTDAPVEGCPAGSSVEMDYISLLDIVSSTITLGGTRLPTVTSDITLQGEGVTVDGGGNSGLMAVSGASASLTISRLSLTNGYAQSAVAPEDSGGAIRVSGDAKLELISSTLSNNTAWANGGGIYLAPDALDLTIRDSTISGNTALVNGGGYGGGGGIFVSDVNSGTLSVSLINSTLSGNSAQYGGGIYNYDRTPAAFPEIRMSSDTITGNTAFFGAGVGVYGYAYLLLANSIVANSTDGTDCATPPSAVAEGVNLIEDGSCLTAGPSRLEVDPMLSPLGAYGGPTLTHLPLDDSPVIGAGDKNVVPVEIIYDQRGVGYPRVFDDEVDLGSVEWSILEDLIFKDSFETPSDPQLPPDPPDPPFSASKSRSGSTKSGP